MQDEYEKPVMSEEAVLLMKQRMAQGKKEKREMQNKKAFKKVIAAAAVLAILALPNTSSSIAYAMGNIPVLGGFFKIITFRDYQCDDGKNLADVVVPKVTTEGNTNEAAAEKARKTADEINAEIQALTDKWVEKFKANMAGEGYQGIKIDYEVIATTDDYFTLKLICFYAAGSGYEENHYYTIDLNTGEKVELADLFKEGSDYKEVISENIKAQMKERMAADDSVTYWLDNQEYPEWNFKEITDETAFYINENGEIVISFNEGDVAPAYMGTVEFTIPNEVVADLMK